MSKHTLPIAVNCKCIHLQVVATIVNHASSDSDIDLMELGFFALTWLIGLELVHTKVEVETGGSYEGIKICNRNFQLSYKWNKIQNSQNVDKV